MDFDFGYGQNGNNDTIGSDNVNDKNDSITDIDTGIVQNDVNGNPADNVDDKIKKEDVVDETDKKDSKTNLVAGTSIEVGDEKYTVDNNGNILDTNGNIFKESKEVQSWLDSFEEVTENNDDNVISINSIKELVGTDIVDADGNSIEYENTPEGVKAYIDAVIDVARDDHYETAINTLYKRYPVLKDVINYYVANGNSMEGYGQLPDRSGITVDVNDEAQQESIIRIAWKERNQKGNVESYINYLKTSGELFSTANDELKALQESDKEYKENLAQEAKRIEEEKSAMIEEYWNGVYDTIKSRKIAGYEIPESIIINRNGQKFTVTPEDFFAYIYRLDEEGNSAYERDLMAETPESRRDDEILRAYLKFVGGNYSNLVNMAINKEQVAKLRLKAKERNSSSVKITKPKGSTAKGADVDLGYN